MNAIYDFVNQHFFYFAISYLFAGWAALGLFFGRHIAVWFPFLLTSRFYLPIPWKRLGRLLTSETTFYWGKKQPRYIHVKYYLVSPANRMKLSGVCFSMQAGFCWRFCRACPSLVGSPKRGATG